MPVIPDDELWQTIYQCADALLRADDRTPSRRRVWAKIEQARTGKISLRTAIFDLRLWLNSSSTALYVASKR